MSGTPARTGSEFVKRIMILGPCGSGKSTLALRLASLLGIAPVHLDQLAFAPGWVERSQADWLPDLQRILALDTWIIDGNDAGTMPLRLGRADTVVFLDFPPILCLWRVVKRIVANRGRTRSDMAPGCPERLDLSFLYYVATWNRGPRRRVEEKLAQANPMIVRFATPRALEDWLRSLAAG
ncbi:MAG: topology modulation protein [Erythrobacter sp.]